MIRFHPADDELAAFVEGLLDPTHALMVAAHCDLCPHCRSKVDAISDVGSALVFEDGDEPEATGPSLDQMLESIINAAPVSQTRSHTQYPATIEFQGRAYRMPESLRRIARAKRSWSRLIGGLWLAPVMIGGKTLANFIFMEKGGIIPEHTHIGNEYTLVMHGSFDDGHNTYTSGDYIALNSDSVHTPKASSAESCLVFTIIDEPLHFTSKWAKLVNPFSHLYFSVSAKL